MADAFGSFITAMLSVLGDWIDGIAGGFSEMVTKLLFTYTEATGGTLTITGLNAFGYFVAVTAGISLAVGISRLVYMLVVTIGGKK